MMAKQHKIIIGVLAAFTLLDSYMLAHPNIIGRIGIWIYKYHYLKTFPKALLTVSLTVLLTAGGCFGIYTLVKRNGLKPRTGHFILYFLILISVVLLVNVIITFSKGSYSHTGFLFRAGANLLPCILIFIFGYTVHELNALAMELQEDSDSKPTTPDV